MIDLERKIIFMHPPKTGGTTIESAFKWHPNYKPKNDLEYVKFFKKFKHSSLAEHIEHIQTLGFLENQFFKFVSIRNPWDIVVSWFYFCKSKSQIPENLTFEDYVIQQCKNPNFLNIEPFLYYKNNFIIDYVIRYETYKEDCENVFKKYNVTWNENFHTSSRPKNIPYQNFYTKKTKEMIENQSKTLIELFNYTF
jgi:hypothetical protein